MESTEEHITEVADLKKQVAALEEQLEEKTQLVDEIISRVINYTS
jgi:cell division septum initiation protein DivIVA